MLKSIVYVSSSEGDISKKTLLAILKKCTKNNQLLNITGMLIYFEGTFIQVLEGEEEVVNAMLMKIASDKRHKNLTVVHDEPIQKREFGNWEMAFRALDDKTLKDVSGFRQLDGLNLEGGEAKGLLKTFYELNVRSNSKYQF